MYTYEIKDNNVVEIFSETQVPPVIRQPHYPNGDAFESAEKAAAWAEYQIASMTDETAPLAPVGAGLEPQPKPTKAEILALLKERVDTMGDKAPKAMLDRIVALEAEIAAAK